MNPKLERVEIENYRAIEKMELPLHPQLTVLHGANAHGKTSVLSAIALGLGAITALLPDVSSVAFQDTDLRGSRPLRVGLRTVDGIEWDRRWRAPRRSMAQLRDALEPVVDADREGNEPIDLPIIVFYDANRAIDVPLRRRRFKTEFPRSAALGGALHPHINFQEFFNWFHEMENEENRERARGNSGYRLPELAAVRSAIESMVPGFSDPRIELHPLRFAVSMAMDKGRTETLDLEQMSGGYRIMLALAADLVRRMAQGNPHLDDPLRSEAVVLIDEVDLHLHPSWQQRVLPDLQRTFPNTQFIVSTHSPQVLSTVRPENVVHLYRENGGIAAGGSSEAIYGAESGAILEAVMGVNERPADNPFVTKLNEYMRLVDDGEGESEAALGLRKELEELSPRDGDLGAADMAIKRRKLFARMGKSP